MPSLLLASALGSAAAAGVFGGGIDVVACAAPTGCVAGNASLATNLTSVDRDGTARFETVFRFASIGNLMAFENAPFAHSPRYGGYCAWALASANHSAWGRAKMGPSIDLTTWRLLSPAAGLPHALYGFGGPAGAKRFVDGLPASMHRADAAWSGWWGAHGVAPPYAVSGGPFNTECFDGGAKTHDCSREPQPLPPEK